MSTIHRGHCHAPCSHVHGSWRTTHRSQESILRGFGWAGSELGPASNDSRLELDPCSLTWSDGASKGGGVLGQGGGRHWSGVEPPLSLQPRLPHGLHCVLSSQCGLLAIGLVHVPLFQSLPPWLGSGPWILGSLSPGSLCRFSPGSGRGMDTRRGGLAQGLGGWLC
jgi:hypothetical protein